MPTLTRSMRSKTSKKGDMRRTYRRRVKQSPCRGHRARTCIKKGCKHAQGRTRSFCRKKSNKRTFS